jgi:hypothetical protein
MPLGVGGEANVPRWRRGKVTLKPLWMEADRLDGRDAATERKLIGDQVGAAQTARSRRNVGLQ